MNKRRSLFVVPAALVLLAGAAIAGPGAFFGASQPDAAKQPEQPKAEITLKIGDKAPELTVDQWIKGDEVTSFQTGKVYVVEFWATWCPPCIKGIPHLTELQKEYAEEVTVIGMAASERTPKEGEADNRLANLKTFVEKKGDEMAYRVAYDSKRAMSNAWMKPAGQNGIPCAFIVDGEGKIAYIGHPTKMDEALKATVAKNKKA